MADKNIPNTYIVKKGDSPWAISHKYGIALEDFYKLNPKARMMIHPNDVVNLVDEDNKTYNARNSLAMLQGVTVTAKRKSIKNTKPIKPITRATESKSSNISIPNIEIPKISEEDIKRSVINAVNKVPVLSTDTKQDINGIINAPTWNDRLQQLYFGAGQKFDKLQRKINEYIPDFVQNDEDRIGAEVGPIIQQAIRENLIRQYHGDYLPTINSTDTIPKNIRNNRDENQYLLSENINLNDTQLGYRNRYYYNSRGERKSNIYNTKPIDRTEGAIISSYAPFLPYGSKALSVGTEYPDHPNSSKSWNYYYGIDNGKFVFGKDYSKFSKNSYLTKTIAHEIENVYEDKNGNSRMTFANGKTSPINITSGNSKVDRVHKGRELIVVGDEARLVSGTISQINSAIQDMKRRHGVDYVTLVELDNGSYSEGLRTYTKNITEKDLQKYYNQNVNNGHFLYINNDNNNNSIRRRLSNAGKLSE